MSQIKSINNIATDAKNCSFCGKHDSEIGILVCSEKTAICESCITSAVSVLSGWIKGKRDEWRQLQKKNNDLKL